MTIAIVGTVLVFTIVTAHGNLTVLVLELAVLTILFPVVVTTNVNLVGNPRPSYGELLFSLFQASIPSACDGVQKQYLIDFALKLYSINGCNRDGFDELLKWIYDRKCSCCDYRMLAEQLNVLLHKNIKWRILQRMWGATVWIWTEPPLGSPRLSEPPLQDFVTKSVCYEVES
jgi:hypothetical protein